MTGTGDRDPPDSPAAAAGRTSQEEDERTEPGDDAPDGDACHADGLRLVEAILFSAVAPVSEAELADRLPAGVPLDTVIDDLRAHYEPRGVNLVPVAGGWAFRTAPDLGPRLRVAKPVPRKLSRAALETLAIIAYHQPLTRSEIEGIRGVAVSKGTIDVLLEAGWIRPGKRRESPGRPLTWVTSPEFLDHFGLSGIGDLPGLGELKAAGLLEPAGSEAWAGSAALHGEAAAEPGTGPQDPVDGEGESATQDDTGTGRGRETGDCDAGKA
ncbi:MAG: SMC-Scp complex subunit ScpB [Alphaproteobacteria bacterium]|jgi:segregation and condensation protein B|nr:SMC-Scp complex subunit ScpB [Alphaproteobacteria bacterium]